MLGQINRLRLHGVLLCRRSELSYLSATYAGVQPYYGHVFNTPDYAARKAHAAAWFRDGEAGEWFESIDLVLVSRTEVPESLETSGWRLVRENEELALFERIGSLENREANRTAEGAENRAEETGKRGASPLPGRFMLLLRDPPRP
jgi:hypothetical protein